MEKKIFDRFQYKEKPLSSKAYKEGGFYILRNEKDYCFISCSSMGQKGLGGHGHNDKLSIVLWINGKQLFVDPGTYVYTGNRLARNMFRGTKYHNTVSIDGLEQNVFNEKSLFRIKEKSNAKCLRFENERFVGEQYGYKSITHRREITFDKKLNEWCIKDSFIGKGRHELEWNYHLSDKIKKIEEKKNTVIVDGKILISLTFKPDLIVGFVSESYGIKKNAKIIRGVIKIDIDPDKTFKTVIRFVS